MTRNEHSMSARLQRHKEERLALARKQMEVDALRARAEHVKSSLNIPAGWTGKTQYRDVKIGKGKHKRVKRVPEKVMAPLPFQSGLSKSQHEDFLAELADASKALDDERKRLAAERAVLWIRISAACSEEEATVLDRYYLKAWRPDHIARELNISRGHVYRIRDKAIAALSNKCS